ncbi:MAG TPA: glycerophosphodiester phosphodiesterase family protein [Bdellovibrionota bacterium]|nr:glycerophosphodiester phosphodiesterase family protein [Bdellovibrionota bacterium]
MTKILLPLVALLFACLAQADILVVGHRGTIVHAPENTIPAFQKAIELGADLLEMDVRETRDGELVIMHDATLDRTTDGTGAVASRTLAEIRAFDAGSWFGAEWRGTRVPTFREVLRAIGGRALPDVDHKAGDLAKIRKELLEAGLLGTKPVPFFDWSWSISQQARVLDRSFHSRPDVGLPVSLTLLLARVDAPIVSFQWEAFSPEFVRRIHQHGRKAWVQILGDSAVLERVKRAADAGVDYIQTDRLEIVVPYLRSRGLHK